MAIQWAAWLFLALLGSGSTMRIKKRSEPTRKDEVQGLRNEEPKDELTDLGIRSTMKLPWPSSITFSSPHADSGASLIERDNASTESPTPLFSTEECLAMQQAAAGLKPPDFDFLEICAAYEEVDVKSTGVDLSGVGAVTTHADGTSLQDSWRMYKNRVLTDIITKMMEAGTIDGTMDGDTGQKRTYADVIRALLDSGIKVYLIGGLVRDLARGLSANDVDIGFSGTANQVTEAIRAKLGVSKRSYLPGMGEELLTVPGGPYFAFGNTESKIEGKGVEYNVFGQYLANDYSMNTAAFDVQCLSRTEASSCYVIDKIGVGLQHALSGTIDLAAPKGPAHYDAYDFNDWISSECSTFPRKPCNGVMRFLKFLARGWRPSEKFRDMIVPAIRVLFAAADKSDFSWSDFHFSRKESKLDPIFEVRREPFPGFAPLDEASVHPLSPDMNKGLFGYFYHVAKNTRLASLKEAVKMAKAFETLLSVTPDGICGIKMQFVDSSCMASANMFKAIVSWSVGTYTGVYAMGAGSFTARPCGEKNDMRVPGWYSLKSGRYWVPSSRNELLSTALSKVADGNCPEEILGTVTVGLDFEETGAHAVSWDDLEANVAMCYVPTGPSDPVLEKLVSCKAKK